MTESVEKSRAWRWLEGTALALILAIPCIVVVRAALGPLQAIVVGFVLAVIFAWINV